MKKRILLLFALLLSGFWQSKAQTTLAAGDVIVIGISCDTQDEFTWVPLVDLSIGTKIYFTDAGYVDRGGGFPADVNTTEVLIKFTASSVVLAGTRMTVSDDGTTGSAETAGDYTTITGTQFGDDTDMNLTSGGDQITVFQSTDAEIASFGSTNFTGIFSATSHASSFVEANGENPSTVATEFFPGISSSNSVAAGRADNGDTVGPLVDGSNVDEYDNVRYTGIVSGTKAQILAAVANSANWTGQDATPGAGYTGGVSGNFTVAAAVINPTWNGTTWSPSAPTASDNAIIDGNYNTSSGDITAANLTVNATFTLTIADGDVVTVAGDLANSGTILVQNNGAFIQTLASPTNSGTGAYTVQRLVDKSILVYNYFSSPVIGETIADVFATNGTNFYSFDVASQNWSALPTATVLGAGDGFAATGNGNSGTITRTFTSNTGFNSGDITKAVTIVGTGGTADDDWNLVGNPYPSGLDFQSFYTSNSANIGTAIYLWDSDGNDVGGTDADYATMTSAGAVNSGAGGTTYPNAIVASGQGFFVEALNNANITFSNSHRSATNNTFFREKEMQRVWLSAKHENGAGNQILIAFAENADEKSDMFDGKKWSESQTLSFYMPVSDFAKGVDSEKLAIQGLPSIEEGRIVELGIEAKQAGKFTFALDKSEYLENQAIFLHDLLTNEFINITKESYTVNLEEGDHSDRFTLRFVGSKVTGVEEDLAAKGVSIYSSGQRLTINFADAQSAEANIAVYDLQGRQLFAKSTEGQTQINLELPLSGIFIVKVETQRGVATQKVYLD